MDRFIAKLESFLAEVCGWVVVLMMLTVSYDVIARYCFGAPTKWSLELNEYFLLFVVYLSGAWALRIGGHVKVDIFYIRLSKRKQLLLDIFTSFLGLILAAILTIEGIKFTYDGYVTGARSETYLEVLQWPIRLFMAVGSLLLFLEFLLKIYRSKKLLGEAEPVAFDKGENS